MYSISYNLRAYFESEEPILQYNKPIIVNKGWVKRKEEVIKAKESAGD